MLLSWTGPTVYILMGEIPSTSLITSGGWAAMRH